MLQLKEEKRVLKGYRKPLRTVLVEQKSIHFYLRFINTTTATTTIIPTAAIPA